MTIMMMMFCIVMLLVLLMCVWRTLNWVWFRPRRIERELWRQGVHGTHYQIPYGDSKDFIRLSKEAGSRPLPLRCHDIAPRVLPLFHKAIKDKGKISLTWVGPIPRVIIMDPEMVRELLVKKFDQVMKSTPTPLTKFLLQGLVNHEGEKWVKHRKIINPAFHMENLKLMLPAFSTSCGELIKKWDKMMSDEGYLELDVFPELQNLTKDIISRTAFGSSYEEGRRIFQLIREKIQLLLPTIQTVPIPGYQFLPTPMNKRISRIDKEMEGIIKGMIEKREKAMRMGEGSKNDILGILMESNMKEAEEHGTSKNIVMTTEDVIAECRLFYLAGQETTSLLLTWTMILLGMYPNWQSKAREEALQVFGRNTPDMDGLSSLKIVTMILYEVLRLYPPISFLARMTYKPIEVGGISYPPGVILSVPILFIHHDTEFWGEDAQEFNPERFAEGISKASKVAGVFIPFSAGPRICIAQSFALIEAKIAVSMILQHFWFELSSSYIHAPRFVIALEPQHGAQLKMHKL